MAVGVHTCSCKVAACATSHPVGAGPNIPGQASHAPEDAKSALAHSATGEPSPAGRGSPRRHPSETHELHEHLHPRGRGTRPGQRGMSAPGGVGSDVLARVGVDRRAECTDGSVTADVSVLKLVSDVTGDGILVVDRHGRVVVANRRFAELWRIPDVLLRSGDDTRVSAFVLDQVVGPDVVMAKIREVCDTPAAESVDTLRLHDGRVYQRYSRPWWPGLGSGRSRVEFSRCQRWRAGEGRRCPE